MELYAIGIVRSWIHDGADFDADEVCRKVSKMVGNEVRLTDKLHEFIVYRINKEKAKRCHPDCVHN